MADESSRQSKFLSLILRHAPETIALELDAEGWASIDDIVARSDIGLTHARIAELVASSPKQRFAISADGLRIRANQGHSISVDLGLEPMVPPETLFHGTATRFLTAIRAEGLKPGARQHVHLSPTRETARKVGQRHGRPAILTVASGRLHRDGQPFFQSDNGVWLTGPVPPAYLGEDPA